MPKAKRKKRKIRFRVRWEMIPDKQANELLAHAIRLIINDPGRTENEKSQGKESS